MADGKHQAQLGTGQPIGPGYSQQMINDAAKGSNGPAPSLQEQAQPKKG